MDRMTALDDRLAALHADLVALPGVLVAFSGGVDSGVVLAAAVRALGAGRVVAATALSPSLPAAERTAAAGFARSLGVRHEQPRTDELSREGYVANAGDRCFFCKAELVDVLTPIAARLGIADVVTGTNADDVRAGFRPGIRAATERGAWAPLARAGLTKDDVRAAAHRWELPLADKPAAACLASRIAYGVPVSAERLARVETAETALRGALAAAGLTARDLRVRDLGAVRGRDTARVEVDAVLVAELAGRPEVLARVRDAAGFDLVELDPRGFRSGSMNELLPDPVRYR
ncbi:ATP-dependent sacrificial sulfur transferase LarE [Modestobacter lapidis]